MEVCAVIVSGMLEREAVVTLTSRDGSAEGIKKDQSLCDICLDHHQCLPLGAVGADYTAVSSDLVFSETVSRVCRNVSTEEDDILEEDEQFLLDLTTSDPSVQLNPNVATVTITDDGVAYSFSLVPLKALTRAFYFIAGVTIGLEETSFTVDEGELVEVCAILISGTLEKEVAVTLQTSDGTAIGMRL